MSPELPGPKYFPSDLSITFNAGTVDIKHKSLLFLSIFKYYFIVSSQTISSIL